MLNRKKIIGKAAVAILAAFLCLTPCREATAMESVTAKIPVTCAGEGTDEAFTYIVQEEADPHQTVRTGSITLKNGETGYLEMEYDCQGEYACTVSQVKGEDPDTTYDDTVYNVKVWVVNDEKTDDTYAVVRVWKDGEDEKPDSCAFTNVKLLPPPETQAPSETQEPSETEAETVRETETETEEETEEETEKTTKKKKKKSGSKKKRKKSSSTKVVRRTYTYSGGTSPEKEADGVTIEDSKTPLAQFRDAVKTGDPRVIVPFFILAGASLAVMAWAIARRRRDRQES